MAAESRFEHGFLEALFSNSGVALAILDSDYRYVRVNDCLAELNGVPAADHVGRTVREVLPGLADSIEGLLAQVIATKEPLIEFGLSGPTPTDPNADKHFLVSYHPIIEGDEAIGVAGLIVEITEQVRASRELKTTARDMFENVVQDLTVAQLALDSGERDQAYQSVQKALTAAKHMTSQVLLEESDL